MKPKRSIKVLGWATNEKLSMDTHMQQTIAKIKYIMSRMNEIKIYVTEKQRLQFANAYLVSSLKYGVQFLAETQSVRYRYHTATMLVARWVKGGYCFRTSFYQICKSIEWDIPLQQIMKETSSELMTIEKDWN